MIDIDYKLLEGLNLLSFELNPIFLNSLLIEKGFSIKDYKNSFLIKINKYWNVFIPKTSEKKLLYKDMLEVASDEIEVYNFPYFFVDYFKKLFSISKHPREYIFRTSELQSLSWKKLKSIRNNVNKIYNKNYKIVELDENNKQDFLDCNNIWYKENWSRFFPSLFFKKEITHTINNESYYDKFWIKTLWLYIDNKIVWFVVWCNVTEKYWALNTMRISDKSVSDASFCLRKEISKYFKQEFCLDWSWAWKNVKETKEKYNFLSKRTYKLWY